MDGTGGHSRDAVSDVLIALLSDIADSSVRHQDGDENSIFGQHSFMRHHERGSVADGSGGSAQLAQDPAGRPNGGAWNDGRSALDFINQHRLQSLWSCEICGTKFNSSQALGGHKINSINHKQLLEILKEGSLDQILHAVMRLRPARSAKSESAGDGRGAKRARLSPMAKMPGYRSVVEGFPQAVQSALEKTQSPASFFSSCSLQVFRRHSKFGRLVDSDLAHAGATAGMTPDEAQEFEVFSRMLQTKKKFLDINRKAVSKRITRIRKQEGIDTKSKEDSGGSSATGEAGDGGAEEVEDEEEGEGEDEDLLVDDDGEEDLAEDDEEEEEEEEEE